jgi:hypothetical protein
MSEKTPTPNDQRSTALNQTSIAHKEALDNYSRQMNPRDTVYQSSRVGKHGRK